MKKGRILKSTLMAFVAIVLTSAAFLSLNTSSALAYDGGSGGTAGSGGTGGLPSGWTWRYADSFDGLRNSQGMGAHVGGAEGYVTRSSGGAALLNNYCLSPDLVRVYWLQNAWGNTTAWSVGDLSLPWTNPAGGDAIDQFASTMNYRGTYVICVVNQVERRTTSESEARNRSDGSGTTFTADYSWTTTVTPELNTAAGVDPIGVDNLNTQPAVSVNSAFAGVYDTITSGSGSSAAKITQVQNAINSDAGRTHANVTLNANNQAGMAEGGVLSVNEVTRRATITITQSWTESRSRSVTCDYRPGSSTPLPGTCTYGSWSNWAENNGSRSHSVTRNMGTQPNTGFYQLLSVHCNPEEFNSLTARLTALGGANAYTVVSQTAGVDGRTTSVIRTAHWSTRTGALNAGRILGVDSASLSNEIRRTGQLGFYDKECDIQCISDPSPALGASTANGATTNASIVSNNVANPGTHGGAVLGGASDNSNSNYFEIFRDNEANRIVLNTAYPVNTDPQLKYGGTFSNAAGNGTVNIPAAAPVSTTVTRWSEGTPDTNMGNQGGVFQMFAVQGNTSTKLFGSQTGTVGNQRNFGVQPFSSANSQALSGFYRTFDVSSTWASEQDRPQVINVKWEYRPTVYTRFPSVLGFAANNNANRITATTEVVRDQPIDVKCYAQYGTTNRDLGLGARVQSSTGTGTTNTLDSGLVESASGDNSWVTESNLVLKFVRGVSE